MIQSMLVLAGFGGLFMLLGWWAYAGKGNLRAWIWHETVPFLDYRHAVRTWIAGGVMGSGAVLIALGTVGVLLPSFILVELVAFLAAMLGFLLFFIGLAFFLYLPRRLRPRWYIETLKRIDQSEQRQRDLYQRIARGELIRHWRPPDELFWGEFAAAPAPSRQIASVAGTNPKFRTVRWPNFTVPGRLSGPLPYLERPVESRRGELLAKFGLFDTCGRVVFVQTEEEDIRLDQSYVLEIKRPFLDDIVSATTPEGRPAVAFVGPETLYFEPESDDPEEVARRLCDFVNSKPRLPLPLVRQVRMMLGFPPS